MSTELESMWDAMKTVHYRRTVEQLEKSLEHTTHLEEALTTALETVVAAVHAQAGTLWFYDRFGDGRIRARAVSGGGDLTGISLLPGEGIAGQVVQSGKAVIIAECQKDPRWAGKADAKTGFRTETMICVPLTAAEMTFGSIQIINKTDGVAFDEKDLMFAEHLADASADLFRKLGLLEEYLTAGGGQRPAAQEITFMQVFGVPSDREMEYQLRRVDAFATLRVSEQEAVLKLAKEMRGFLGKKAAPSPTTKKRGFWK